MMQDHEKRIALMINGLGYGGAERVFVDDANRFAQAGYSISMIFLYGNEDAQPLIRELDERVTRLCAYASGPFDFDAAKRVRAFLREQGASVLISTLNDANIMARWCVVGTTTRLFVREANDPQQKRTWQRALDIALGGLAARTIAVSEQVRAGIVADAPWRAGRVVVLGNAVTVPPARAARDAHPFRILTVGSLTEQKDQATFIAALARLKASGVAFEARIAGGGPLEAELKDTSAHLGTSELSFLGKIPHDEIMREYAWADAFVLSSRWEGSPNALLEAMASGLPVVATQASGISEIVEDGVTGILVSPRDSEGFAEAMRRLAADANLRRAIGSAARAYTEKERASEWRFARLGEILGL